MTLQAMIVSHDWQEVSVLECILNSLHITVDVHSDVDRARAQLAKSKVDAIIVDRDLSGTDQLIEHLPSSNSSVPLLLLHGTGRRSRADATFFFEKPVSVEDAVRTLSATRSLMLDGRLRYQRHSIDVPVSLSVGRKKKITAHAINVSRGGIGIHGPHMSELRGSFTVCFRLPGVKTRVEAQGELAWASRNGRAGIRFLEVPEQLERRMQMWLEKRYFAN